MLRKSQYFDFGFGCCQVEMIYFWTVSTGRAFSARLGGLFILRRQALKFTIMMALAAATLVAGSAAARPYHHGHQVCHWQHHHKVCHWQR